MRQRQQIHRHRDRAVDQDASPYGFRLPGQPAEHKSRDDRCVRLRPRLGEMKHHVRHHGNRYRENSDVPAQAANQKSAKEKFQRDKLSRVQTFPEQQVGPASSRVRVHRVIRIERWRPGNQINHRENRGVQRYINPEMLAKSAPRQIAVANAFPGPDQHERGRQHQKTDHCPHHPPGPKPKHPIRITKFQGKQLEIGRLVADELNESERNARGRAHRRKRPKTRRGFRRNDGLQRFRLQRLGERWRVKWERTRSGRSRCPFPRPPLPRPLFWRSPASHAAGVYPAPRKFTTQRQIPLRKGDRSKYLFAPCVLAQSQIAAKGAPFRVSQRSGRFCRSSARSPCIAAPPNLHARHHEPSSHAQQISFVNFWLFARRRRGEKTKKKKKQRSRERSKPRRALLSN
jgi:hypothetical protein